MKKMKEINNDINNNINKIHNNNVILNKKGKILKNIGNNNEDNNINKKVDLNDLFDIKKTTKLDEFNNKNINIENDNENDISFNNIEEKPHKRNINEN